MEEDKLPHTRISGELNSIVDEILSDYQKLLKKAKDNGLDIRLYPNSESLELYFNDDYLDTILVDKKLSARLREEVK